MIVRVRWALALGERRPGLLLAVLFVCALTLRLATIGIAIRSGYGPNHTMRGNSRLDVAIAVSLTKGEGFSSHYRPVLDAVLQDVRTLPPQPPRPTSKRSVAYPWFLAGIFSAFGFRLNVVLVVQAILSSLSVLLIYAIGRHAGGYAVGLIAGACAVLYYPFWYEATYLLIETLLIFLTALAVLATLRNLSRPSVLAGAASGLAIGASALVKPLILPLVPVYLVLGYVASRRRGAPSSQWALSGAALLVALAVVLAPASIRNYRHHGPLHPAHAEVGYHLLLLYNPYDSDFAIYEKPGFISETYPGIRDVVEGEILRARARIVDPIAAEYAADDAMRRRVVEFVWAHPGYVLRAVPHNLYNTWRWDYPDARAIRKISNAILYLGLLPFVVVGAVVGVRRRNTSAMWLAILIAYFTVTFAILPSQIRYRMWVMPAFFVMGALGLHATYGYGRRPDGHA